MSRWRPAICALCLAAAFPHAAANLFMLVLFFWIPFEVGYPEASERALNWFLPPPD